MRNLGAKLDRWFKTQRPEAGPPDEDALAVSSVLSMPGWAVLEAQLRARLESLKEVCSTLGTDPKSLVVHQGQADGIRWLLALVAQMRQIGEEAREEES